jgi:hypothetical protein
MPARLPLEMPGRYRFHSTRPAPWKRVSVASTASPRAVLQCPAVEVREGLGRSPRPRPTFHAYATRLPRRARNRLRSPRRGVAVRAPRLFQPRRRFPPRTADLQSNRLVAREPGKAADSAPRPSQEMRRCFPKTRDYLNRRKPNSASLCSAPMTSRNSLTIGIS